MARILTDYSAMPAIPEFYADIMTETIAPEAALRILTTKLQKKINEKAVLTSVGIVVDSITTSSPQTFLNRLIKATTTGGTNEWTEYKVVLTEDFYNLENEQCVGEVPTLDVFKWTLARYFPTAAGLTVTIPKGARVKITYVDSQRSEGLITDLI